MRNWIILTVLLVSALAGCADSAPAPEDDGFSDEFDQELQATDDTGIIRGVVVDASITPIVGAKVTLTALGLDAETNENGEFGFAELDPTTYFIEVSKLGYESIQQSVQVEAGVDQPPIVRVQLAVDEGYNPFSALQVYKGFYQCGTSLLVVCGAPNILLGQGTTDDSSTPDIYLAPNPEFLQVEMVWDSTQAASPNLYFEMEALNDGCDSDDLFLSNAEGGSPIRATANKTVLMDSGIGGDCPVYLSVFAGDALGGAHCPAFEPLPVRCLGVGFSVQQDFEWFITEYHGYTPPEDWWFIEDGEYDPPQE